MSKGLIVIAATIGFSMMSQGALADHRHHYGHDKELAYLLGGALVGAAIGGLIYSDRYGYYGYRHYPRYGHYRYAPRGYYRPYRRHYVRHYHPHKRYRRYRRVYYAD